MSVPYHHPDDDYLSIEFVNPNVETVQEEAASREDEATDILSFDLDSEIYVLYAGTKPPGDAEEVEQDAQSLVEGMSGADEIIVTRILGAFSAILEQQQLEEGQRVRAYKDLESDGIPTALDRVDWNGTVAEVGGEIISNLILRHPFPNANHRTALVLLEAYASAHKYGFDMPRMHTEDYEWKTWANEYIRESKRLLTLNRNSSRFYYLWKSGCDTVVRKGGIEISLEDRKLFTNINKAHEYYAEEHVQLCRKLAAEIAERQDREQLLKIDGMSKHEFAERIREVR